MNALIEKRKEIADKLEQLMSERAGKIEAKVKAYSEEYRLKIEAYRNQLNAEPLSEEILNAKKVLDAIDEVIKYDINNTKIEVQVRVDEPKAEPEVVVEAQPVAEAPKAEEVKVEPAIAEEVKIEVSPAVEAVVPTEMADSVQEARPGMSYIGIPERR